MRTLFTITLFCACKLVAQTPDEARKELTKAYLEG